MKLWLITQDVNNDYDTYDSAVVVAATEEEARRISPDGFRVWNDGAWHFQFADGSMKRESRHDSWADPDQVKAVCIGEAADGLTAGQKICASFNAG